MDSYILLKPYLVVLDAYELSILTVFGQLLRTKINSFQDYHSCTGFYINNITNKTVDNTIFGLCWDFLLLRALW